MEPIDVLLDRDDAVLEQRWTQLQQRLEAQFGRSVGMEGILFLIGVQSAGRGYEPKLKKEAKQDLVMEGTYCAFETLGVYRRVGSEPDGRGVWERAVPPFEKRSVAQQEKLLRIAVLRYFDTVFGA